MGIVRARDDSCNNALCGPGGVRAVIAEHLLLKQQLLVLHRPRQRAPHLTASDRRLSRQLPVDIRQLIGLASGLRRADDIDSVHGRSRAA